MLVLDFLIGLACAGVAAAMAIAWLMRPLPEPADVDTKKQVAFLFKDVDLIHASPGAEALLKSDNVMSDWQALWHGLGKRFPGFPREIEIADVKKLTLGAARADDTSTLRIEREGDAVRVTIDERASDEGVARQQVKALEAEIDILRPAALSAPFPIWLESDDGAVRWSNTVFDTLTEPRHEGDAHAVFDEDRRAIKSGHNARVAMRRDGDPNQMWFDVYSTTVSNGILFHATNVDAVMRAEAAQRNFVQTLAKTFAQLSIGLAIFDRNGQLALFNPALMDLTSLPAGFLSARPDLLSFFDRLRDNRVMPEPKNYKSWRQDITDLIAAANQGSYQETWTLDTGHTYQVSGRPHPDGAVAFLIEDITAEISLTRNFRAELELGQSLLDTLEDALVVFSSAGILSFCNSAYREMWKLDPDSSFADVTIIDSIKAWQSQCAPDPAWGDMRDFVLKITDRAPWEATVHHNVLGPQIVSLAPVASGSTVIRFSTIARAAALVEEKATAG